jgi:hypothetical protein
MADVRVHEISTSGVDDLNNNEICSESTTDTDLDYNMWGGKDNSGNVTRWLAKDEKARVTQINIVDSPLNTSQSGVDIDYTPSTTVSGSHSYSGIDIDVSPDISSGQLNFSSVSAIDCSVLTDTNMEGTLVSLIGINIQAGQSTGTGTVSEVDGLLITRWNNSGDTTASYGIKIGSQVGSADNNWALAVDDDADCYFTGDLGIGTNSPSAKLDVIGDLRIQLPTDALVFEDADNSTTSVGAPNGVIDIVIGGTNSRLQGYARS